MITLGRSTAPYFSLCHRMAAGYMKKVLSAHSDASCEERTTSTPQSQTQTRLHHPCQHMLWIQHSPRIRGQPRQRWQMPHATLIAPSTDSRSSKSLSKKKKKRFAVCHMHMTRAAEYCCSLGQPVVQSCAKLSRTCCRNSLSRILKRCWRSNYLRNLRRSAGT